MNFRRKALAGCALVALALSLGQGSALAQGQKPPIKLGLITPLTGPLASYGKAQEMVMKLAVEDVNAKGGINGSPLQLDVQDSSTDPGQAVLLFRKFAGEGYFAVVGPMTGTQWETVSPLANRIQMPAIAANANKPGITVRPWTIRIGNADDTVMPEGIKDFLAAFPKVKKVVIMADVREASSKASADVYAALAKQHGLEVLETVEFSSRATDFSAAAIQIKSRNPDAILSAAFPAQAMLIAKDLKTQGVNVPVLNTGILWPGTFVNNVGEYGRNWHAMGFSTNDAGPPGSDAALYKSVVERALKRSDASMGIPFNFANWGVSYDSVLLFADIARRLRLESTTDPVKAREAIRGEFMKLKTFSGAHKYAFQENGDAHIRSTVLAADVDRKVWKFINK
ncbi:MAG: branched-chain amino acid abc transporter, amino acid-binding protein [Ramlibacter sp.]|jgi:branched-chain amino acid transport system substrate-binding protein|nr:branched-chain amino acid abc transporter, amino acid-binding protein [Ramlibacter sp.]